MFFLINNINRWIAKGNKSPMQIQGMTWCNGLANKFIYLTQVYNSV